MKAELQSSMQAKEASTGCVFAGRCQWQLGALCETERPPWRHGLGTHRLRCHHSLEKLTSLAGEGAAATTEKGIL
jgi:peptide/nickel transport system ATP-binding protein